MNPWDIVSETLTFLVPFVQPGVTTFELNNLGAKKVRDLGGVCFDKFYKPEWAKYPFPAEMCICVNDEIAHGIPSSRKIKSGDIVQLDLGVSKDGICGDGAITVPVGEIDQQTKRLLKTAKKALYAGIEVIKPGVKVRKIAEAIEDTARHKGFVVNRQFTGHGIGSQMHEDPPIYHAKNYFFNYPDNYKAYEEYLNATLQEGQKVCLEPMLTESDSYGVREKNDWTFKTADGKKSAMFEHMVLVTKTGCEILTKHLSP